MKTFLVQMAEPHWTEQALHLACAMARTSEANLILLKLIPVQHYSWIGTSFGFDLSPNDSEQAWNCKAIAASYGVDLNFQPMQYISLTSALVEATEQQEAQAAFACIPASILPLWRRLQEWDLRRQLERRGCALYTLDRPVQAVIPATKLDTLRQHT